MKNKHFLNQKYLLIHKNPDSFPYKKLLVDFGGIIVPIIESTL